MMHPDELKHVILAAMPGAKVEVSDLTGGGDHFRIEVTAQEFQGKLLVEQHKRVHEVLKDLMDTRIHAVQIKTRAQ